MLATQMRAGALPCQRRAVVAPRAASTRPARLTRAPRNSSRPVQCYVSAVTEAPVAPLRLLQRVKLHQAAVTSIMVLKDGADLKQAVTASLDKNLICWNILTSNPETNAEHGEQAPGSVPVAIQTCTFTPPGGPVFSILQAPAKPQKANGTCNNGNGCCGNGTQNPLLFLGTASKTVLQWEPFTSNVEEVTTMADHTGWVRSLALQGNRLFSCGCNFLRVFDVDRSTPKELQGASLYTGDILSIATGPGRVFASSADGSIHSWPVPKSGPLGEEVEQGSAHGGRVSQLLFHQGLLFSVSYDGSIKVWDGETLELVREVQGAHGGERIYCAVIGPDKLLYTGGDDKVIRVWDPLTLEPVEAGQFMGHEASVRALAAGPCSCLLSGDANGELAIWSP